MKIFLYIVLVLHLSLSLKHGYLWEILICLVSPTHLSSQLEEISCPSDLYLSNCINNYISLLDREGHTLNMTTYTLFP